MNESTYKSVMKLEKTIEYLQRKLEEIEEKYNKATDEAIKEYHMKRVHKIKFELIPALKGEIEKCIAASVI